MTIVETPEQAAASQRQIEQFVRQASSVHMAVAELQRAFKELADFPESVDAAMDSLVDAAATIADVACDWAASDNAAFTPSGAVDRMFDDVFRCAAKLVANGKHFLAIDSISGAFAPLADIKDRDQRVKALGTLAVEAMKAQRKHDQSIATAAVTQ